MDLRYPTGRFTAPAPGTMDQAAREAAIAVIADTPRAFRAAVADLTDAQLDTPYREGGWTVRQLAHHVPDSHLNAYCRFKLGLTEDHPTIKAYEEAAWARLPDSTGPISPSLDLLTALHLRWVDLLRAMTSEDFARTLHHPESGVLRLDTVLALYAWHGPHHVAHVTGLRQRMGW